MLQACSVHTKFDSQKSTKCKNFTIYMYTKLDNDKLSGHNYVYN